MPDSAIRVEHLSKLHHSGARQQRHDTLRDALVATFKRANVETLERSEDLWALRDVSFEVKQGEVVGTLAPAATSAGVSGRNGARKSTLLKILSRSTEPTSGRAELHGRIASPLEVEDLTGRSAWYTEPVLIESRQNFREEQVKVLCNW